MDLSCIELFSCKTKNRKRNKKDKRKEKEAKEFEKLAKEQPEDVHFEERDYLSEWNQEHPEQFMDLRLRTIEDEMVERQKMASDAFFTVDEAAWVDDDQVVGEPRRAVDCLASGDCFKDCSDVKVTLFEADFCEVDFQPVDKERVRLIRSVSLPVLGGIAVDDPVYIVRNHRRFRRRRCDMAADPAFLRDIISS